MLAIAQIELVFGDRQEQVVRRIQRRTFAVDRHKTGVAQVIRGILDEHELVCHHVDAQPVV